MFLRTQKRILARIQVSLAGLVAEGIWFGQTTSREPFEIPDGALTGNGSEKQAIGIGVGNA